MLKTNYENGQLVLTGDHIKIEMDVSDRTIEEINTDITELCSRMNNDPNIKALLTRMGIKIQVRELVTS